MRLIERIEASVDSIRKYMGNFQPDVAVILGSGFAGWIDGLTIQSEIAYADILGFPTTSVIGHKGRLITASIGGVNTIIMQGRFHYYEGHSMQEISIPVRVFKNLGVKDLLLTNAAGGINLQFKPGHLMVIEDHINLAGSNPLIGENLEQYGVRFPDAANVYSRDLQVRAHALANSIDLKLQSGVYLFTPGPSFETPAEIRMMRTLGADAVGMSTVPEALVANHAGMRVFGLSLIANLASGMSQTTLTHEEVLATMSKVEKQANNFITLMVSNLSE